MNKQESIEFLIENHKKMEFMIDTLHDEEMVQHHIVKAWTIKDIIAHLAAWNKELNKSIDWIISKQDVWYRKGGIDEYNKIQVTIRKSRSLKEIIDEWQVSFSELIDRIKLVSNEEWEFESEYKWKDGNPIKTKHLFSYRYLGFGHEGGHAWQIEDYFESDRCACRVY